MDKYDYITATIEEEKIRLEKIIHYLEENNELNEILEYKERYNTICKYLNAKERYLNINNKINNYNVKLEELNRIKDEYEVDNILLEDTLLSKFNDDTNNKYKNVLYEDIKNYDDDIRDILYLIFQKENNYSELSIKRNRLFDKIDKNIYPLTYDTLVSQNVLIEKQDSILNDIYMTQNNIKIEEDKLSGIRDSVMTDGILKLLYEFWIIDSYNPNKVDKSKLFNDNKNLINIKNSIDELPPASEIKEEENSISDDNKLTIDLNLPGVNEDNLIDIDGKNYVKSDK